MTIVEPDRRDRTPADVPTRHRAAQARGARMGRPLKVLGRVTGVDEALLDEIGRGYLRVDEAGAALAAAVRSRSDDRVRLPDVHRALAEGLGAVPDAPTALRDFLEVVTATPAWLDPDLLEEGARVYRAFGRNAGDVLLQLSLIGGYRFGGPTDLLVATGGLTGDTTMRRLAETQHWAVTVSEPGAMRPPSGGGAGGAGWRLTVHVRLMHALVNHRFDAEPSWDAAHWGRPINQSDQAATLGLFSGALLIGVRALGVPVSREDSRAVMHLWRYVGWLMGVDEAWLFDRERDQHRFSYHVLLSQDDVSDAGRELTRSIVDAQPRLHFRRFARWQRWYAPRRLLSMLRPFLGRRSLEELGLPVRLPWATVGVLAANAVRYRVLGRGEAGRRRVAAWSARYRAEQMYRYFGPERSDVGALR